jgi:hypothetical protein
MALAQLRLVRPSTKWSERGGGRSAFSIVPNTGEGTAESYLWSVEWMIEKMMRPLGALAKRFGRHQSYFLPPREGDHGLTANAQNRIAG